jgi:hypothetical protein
VGVALYISTTTTTCLFAESGWDTHLFTTPGADALAYAGCHTVLCSFKQDPQAASKLLAKSLSDDAKRQLLAALEASQGPPELSR